MARSRSSFSWAAATAALLASAIARSMFRFRTAIWSGTGASGSTGLDRVHGAGEGAFARCCAQYYVHLRRIAQKLPDPRAEFLRPEPLALISVVSPRCGRWPKPVSPKPPSSNA